MSNAAVKQELSPMMARYLEFKERYPDALLFFQVGDFYELFFQDAVEVARALNLTLTSRDKNSPQPIPMCGVPLAVLDGYIDRLLPLGFSVAVVSQTGSGAGVERALERFVTPGMKLFTSVASDSTQSFIAAVSVAPSGTEFSIALTDPQTGELLVKDALDPSTLPRELGMYAVREVVLPRSAFGDAIDRRSSWVRGVETAVGKNLLRFRAEPLRGNEGTPQLTGTAASEFYGLSPLAKRAVRILLGYLDEVSLGNPVPIANLALARSDNHVAIDASTRRNLELVQNSKDGSVAGTLFGFLDKTATPLGARQLKGWILHPLISRDEILKRQAAVLALRSSFDPIHEVLHGVPDLERLAARVQLGIASPKDLAAVRDTLERLPQLQGLMQVSEGDLLSELRAMLDLPEELFTILSNSLVASPPHTTNEGGIFKSGFDQELDQITALRSNAEAWRAAFEAKERESTGITSLKVRSNNVIGYFIEVPTAHGSRVPATYQRRQSTANAERFVTPELKEHETAVVTATDRQIRREQLLFATLREQVARFVTELRVLASALSTLDALTALAERSVSCAWVAPTIVNEPVLEISAGFHPIVADLLQGAFVPNSLLFPENGPTCYVLTGPNMGGKSTYLRQAALITILAQIGSCVPALSATVGIVDRIFARLGAADDLHEGDSTFMVEMREAAQILASASSRSLVLIDELGRGTATSDGLSLAQAILEQLALVLKARTLFATHYHELTSLSGLEGKVANLSVGSVEEEDRVVFTHQIQEGPAPRSYGLEVAKLSGLPAVVLARAYEVLEGLSQSIGTQQIVSRSSRQMALFAERTVAQRTPAEAHEVPVDKVAAELKRRITALKPDELTPRQALQVLYELKELV
jgi:DNA mismatch repair protein MutS